MDRLVIPLIDDWHLHVRQGEMMKRVLWASVRCCGRGVIMPNPVPPILNGQDVGRYRGEFMAAQQGMGNRELTPLMTIKIVPGTTIMDVDSAAAMGAFGGKVYPRNMTHNSEDGVEDYQALYPIFARMEKRGLALLLHGESPRLDAFCLDREAEFMPTLRWLAGSFPRLRIILEHVTTEVGVQTVMDLGPNVGATITLHHMMLTLDDVVGHGLRPHNFCKPLAKRAEDRDAVKAFAMSGNPKAIFGSDSAPHLRGLKECDSGCAGIWTAPVLPEKLVEVFEDAGRLEALPRFLHAGADFHGLPRQTETITLVREAWQVPTEIEGIVPFMAGRELRWRLVG